MAEAIHLLPFLLGFAIGFHFGHRLARRQIDKGVRAMLEARP